MKIKKGDTVIITAGTHRTKSGKVLRAFPKEGRIYVEGITRKKHKRTRTPGKPGEVISVPFPIAVSSVKLLCPRCGKPTRVGRADAPEGGAGRLCKKCGQTFE